MLSKQIPLSVALLLMTVATAVSYSLFQYANNVNLQQKKVLSADELASWVLPSNGYSLDVRWGDLGKKLIEAGTINRVAFLDLYKEPLSSQEYVKILDGATDSPIAINSSNSRFVLNLLWALGLTQESKVLKEGEMSTYGDVTNFASTGGWTIAGEDFSEYYNSVNLLSLDDAQQERVYEIAQNIYRPCCNNSTAFPDCNHGMAMLGLIEIMVANNHTDDDIYDAALAFNSYWFPDTYLTIADYMYREKSLAWDAVDAKLVLGKDFSSATGFADLKAKAYPLLNTGGGSCGV